MMSVVKINVETAITGIKFVKRKKHFRVELIDDDNFRYEIHPDLTFATLQTLTCDEDVEINFENLSFNGAQVPSVEMLQDLLDKSNQLYLEEKKEKQKENEKLKKLMREG